MRGIVRISSGLLSAVLLTACASAVPPSRLGDYVSSEHRAGEESLTQIEQRPLKAGLVLVSDTAEAGAALTEIRAQPSRYLDHQFETDNTDVETGYSPKWVTISRPSSEFGETLAGEARARWDAAKPG